MLKSHEMLQNVLQQYFSVISLSYIHREGGHWLKASFGKDLIQKITIDEITLPNQ